MSYRITSIPHNHHTNIPPLLKNKTESKHAYSPGSPGRGEVKISTNTHTLSPQSKAYKSNLESIAAEMKRDEAKDGNANDNDSKMMESKDDNSIRIHRSGPTHSSTEPQGGNNNNHNNQKRPNSVGAHSRLSSNKPSTGSTGKSHLTKAEAVTAFEESKKREQKVSQVYCRYSYTPIHHIHAHIHL